MRILLVSGEYPPQTGGVGAYTAELAHALRQLGVEPAVLTSVVADEPLQQEAIPVRRTMHAWRWRTRAQVAAVAKEVQANWIHVQYQTGAFGMHPAINLAVKQWRTQGYNVAWTYHDLLLPYLFPKAGRRLRQWVTRQPARYADLLIATNQADFAGLQTVATGALMDIPIGSNIKGRRLDASTRRALRTRYGYGDEELIVGYFGFLNHSKGGLTLVRTVHQLIERGLPVRLHMIGERAGAGDATNFAYLQQVEALLTELNLADRVQWTGRLDDAAVAAQLNGCDVLLMP